MPPVKPFPIVINPIFQPLVSRFEYIGTIQVNVSIRLANLPSNRSAECIGAYINVSRTFWNSIYTTDDLREQVLFHELGHCVLGRGHNNLTGPLGIYTYAQLSIMNAVSFGNQPWYHNYKKYYYDELFGRSTKVL